MGKKGSWFCAIKRVFTSNSKQKPATESSKEKKKGRGGILKKSFIPFSREPSSIEKILGEVDQHNLFIGHPTQPHQPSFSGRPASPTPRPASPKLISPRVASPRLTSPTTFSPRAAASPRVVLPHTESCYIPQPTPLHHASATRIQAAYRGFMARRSFRGLTGLVRLQEVVRGQNVKRQTVNAMKQMQLLVRVQTQIQSRRIQMLESQLNNNDKQLENSIRKNQLEMGDDGEWDDSLVTKEEREARLQKKVEAVIKRERAMAYAYSHQSRKGKSSVMDIRSGGYPWWWNWLERQLPSDVKNPSRPTPDHKVNPRPRSSSSCQDDTRSSRSMVPLRSRQQQMTPPNLIKKHFKTRASPSPSPSSYPMKDDDSLMSCPPFSVPNYMSPTVSAKAKARPTSNPKDRLPNPNPSTPGSDSSKRRFSFPQSPSVNGSFNWNKTRHKSPGSVDSTVSMPPTLGRKPFNRFA